MMKVWLSKAKTTVVRIRIHLKWHKKLSWDRQTKQTWRSNRSSTKEDTLKNLSTIKKLKIK